MTLSDEQQFLTEVVAPDGYKFTVNTGLFINNEFVAGENTIDTTNPATGKLLATVQAAEAKQVDMAVDAAEKAFHHGWKSSHPRERSRLLNKLADLIERDTDEIAHLESLDSGKAIMGVRNFDAPHSINQLRYFSGFCDKNHGKVIQTNGKLSYTIHEPIGVCAGIIAWNVSTLMITYKIAPALCVGNTVVIKTSEFAPLAALKIAALVREAGFPPGVINIISGYGHTAGEAMSHHKKIGKISFTGSVATGRLIMKGAAESNLKKVTLELGGKSPVIIFDDVENLDEAVTWVHTGGYSISGQACCAGSRVYVQEGIYDQFIEKLKTLVLSKKIGCPFEQDTFQGPQVSETQFKRVMDYIDIGKKEGATCYLGGNSINREGYYIEPTIFTDVTENMRIMQEEIFGPVICVAKFRDENDVIFKANDTTYGLAAGVFTANVTRALTVSKALEAGQVWVNCFMTIDSPIPFGGYKQSGFGRECSEYALMDYIQIKSIKINAGNPV
ncbi:aldehyde dehydrogenase domain-containing protein [Phascolomyces articulosus]|uniref:Aldehyde dehydrogenase domain-containing protein n=1 Tax=Phascolomyces articulosus TaxID=60185 RepID=A0AAD5L0F9_9FUNG|nr:aldehyde dehydrogenase domain-containing protein [Phascolomyces articulosus]